MIGIVAIEARRSSLDFNPQATSKTGLRGETTSPQPRRTDGRNQDEDMDRGCVIDGEGTERKKINNRKMNTCTVYPSGSEGEGEGAGNGSGSVIKFSLMALVVAFLPPKADEGESSRTRFVKPLSLKMGKTERGEAEESWMMAVLEYGGPFVLSE